MIKICAFLLGITNKKKKDRLVWDDIVNKWVPQFGFKKKQAEQEKNWCIPIKAEFHLDLSRLK